MVRLWCVLIGYLFGNFQTAYIIGKMKGIDIREHGSGNAGTTNTFRVLGTKAGILVFVGDMVKSIIAVNIVRYTFAAANPQIFELLLIYTGLGCVLGHNFPFYLKFRGGKGIATTGGMIIAFHWYFIPIDLVLFFGTFLITHYASLGSLLLYLGFFVQLIICGCIGCFTMSQGALIEMYIVVLLMTILAFYKHRGNIVRLIKGEERKTYLRRKK